MKRYIFFINLLIFFACSQEDKVIEMYYPRVDIIEEVIQDETGITFSGTILAQGELPTIEKGFVWSEKINPSIDGSNIKVDNPNVLGQYTCKATIDLKGGKTYYLRAFARTENVIVYSEEINFESYYTTPSPVITDFYPKQGRWGDTIRITGRNFSFLFSKTNLYIGNLPAKPISCTDSVIYFKVPEVKNDNVVSLVVQIDNRAIESFDNFTYQIPDIYDYMPKTGTFGDTITITGNNFHQNINYSQVYFNNISAIIISVLPTQIKAIVPGSLNIYHTNVSVESAGSQASFSPEFLITPPEIFDFSPKEIVSNNTVITLTGKSFSTLAQYNKVKIGNYDASIYSAANNQLKVLVPYQLIPDPLVSTYAVVPIQVTTIGQSTTASESLTINYKAK
jgi:hypothetical protein